MNRFVWMSLLTWSFTVSALGQCEPPWGPIGPPIDLPPELVPLGPPAPQDTPESDTPVSSPTPLPLQVKAPTQPLQVYDRIIYVLDVSSSMRNKLAEAVAVIDVFACDEFKAAAITFSGSHERWTGVPEPCEHPKGSPHIKTCIERNWAWMPKGRQALVRHLRGFTGKGGTHPNSALDHAIKNAPERTLVVLISDGKFQHEDIGADTDGENHTNDGEVQIGAVTATRQAMAWRRQRNLAPVQMLVWATSEADSKRESLVQLAALGGGGLWRADTRLSGPW